ncbi:DUF1905 domain-containing protein [Candidatus Saccharibacteria bacterium]|nr:DUF1905 domain-containing protein [Candidatus Saccharibacteria bacterium]
MPKTLSFEAKIEKVDSKGGWHYVMVPSDIRSQLIDWAGKNGNLPIVARLGKSTWISTIMSMGQQRWFFAIKAEVRTSENVTEGDNVVVQIEPDFARLKPVENSHDEVAAYIARIPAAAIEKFTELRTLTKSELPEAKEVFSYGIIGYKTNPKKRAVVLISGWKDHVAVYPIPKNELLRKELEPYIRGKGTLWFSLDQTLPTELIKRTMRELSGLS